MNLHRLVKAIDHLPHRVRHSVRRAPADGIRHRQRVHVPVGRHLLDDVEEAIELRARRVDGEEDRVEAGRLRRERRVDRRLHRAVHRPAVGVPDHVIAGGDLDDDAADAARLHDLDLVGDAAREREHLRLQAERGDVLDRAAILIGDRGHAGLDAVHAQRIELPRDRDLLLAAEDDGSLLLAVTQRHVVNLDAGGEAIVPAHLREVAPRADEPLVAFPGLRHVTPPSACGRGVAAGADDTIHASGCRRYDSS